MEINTIEPGSFPDCAKEPIHIPGAVQPFGLLLGVDYPSLRIHNASLNCQEAFGIRAEELIGRSLAEFISEEQFPLLQEYLASESVREQAAFDLTLCLPSSLRNRHWELTAHRHSGCLLLELEPSSAGNLDLLSYNRRLGTAVQLLYATGSLKQLCDVAVQQVKEITGFDRVMLYQFTEDWHGRVVAEACAPHMHSYLGHYFPASDIPPQARAVFLQNWLRMIPDVGYAPVPLYPGMNPLNGAPLDLSHAALRSVSPIHLEYLRNMQVKATLTISLLDDGKLWGLIACHHATPRLLDTSSRVGARMVGQLVSSQIHLKHSLDDTHYRARLRAVHQSLLHYMGQEEDLVAGLVKHQPNMLDLAAARGAAAAVYHDNQWTIVGDTPDLVDIEKLVDWLSQRPNRNELYFTNQLSKHFPPAHGYRNVASGLAAIPIPKSERNYILWFRPEVATTVVWAGNPEKPVRQAGDHLTLHPRASFNSWLETVEGVSLPWKKVEIDAITELRNSILALDLEREFHKEQYARAAAEKASLEKENMVHVVSHDLRTPLSIIKISLEMMQRKENALPDSVHSLLQRGLRAADAIDRLASGVLDLVKVENGTAKRHFTGVAAGELVRDAFELAMPLAERKAISLLECVEEADSEVWCERNRIDQVLGNLISNALKFTPQGGRITASVRKLGDMLVFSIEDTGVGIAPENVERVFVRFWQEEKADAQGTGLGLAIAREIVEQHKGSIWARNIPEGGSVFSFTLPLATDADIHERVQAK